MAIKKNDEFEAIYPTLDLDGLTFLNIVDRIEQKVLQKYGSTVTQGSLNNCRGTWNELAFMMEAHRSILRSTADLYIVKMEMRTVLNCGKYTSHHLAIDTKNF
jgi:hypothetical protein